VAARDWIAGAMLWCYQDYKSRRNLWPGQTEGYVEHGVVDEWRQRKPSYEAWKNLSAPAKIDAQWLGKPDSITGFTATVTPNTAQNIPYYPLHDYQLLWNLYDGKGKLMLSGKRSYADLNQPEQVGESLPSDAAAKAPHLVVTLLSPTDDIAAARSLEWPAK
jgi:beta-glucuronidase